MMFTSRLTSGGRSRRSACGRITKACRPIQPKPSADAASCCSLGIDCTAPRVASATCALPQSVSAIEAEMSASNSRRGLTAGSRKKTRKMRHEDRQPAPDLDVEPDQRARRQELDRQQRAERDADQRASRRARSRRSGAFPSAPPRACSGRRARPSRGGSSRVLGQRETALDDSDRAPTSSTRSRGR